MLVVSMAGYIKPVISKPSRIRNTVRIRCTMSRQFSHCIDKYEQNPKIYTCSLEITTPVRFHGKIYVLNDHVWM